MQYIGFFQSADGLGYIAQYKATRDEVMTKFDDALANRKLAFGDQMLSFFEPTEEKWLDIRDCLKSVDRIMAGTFFEEAVPAWDGDGPNQHTKVPCRCPVAFLKDADCPSGDAQPWDFIRAWDAQWGAFDYESSKGQRAVIYIVG